MATVKDIQSRASVLEAYWQPRNARIDEWVRLETLFDTNANKGMESAVTNDPATLMAMAVHLLSSQPVKHRVKVGGQDRSAYAEAGTLERGLEGWWNLVDEMAFFSGRDSTNRELAYWLTLTGWHAEMLGVTEDTNGELLPVFDMFDPREAYPEYGARTEGLRSFARKWNTTLGEAQGLAMSNGVSLTHVAGDPTQTVSIIDYYQVVMDKVLNWAVFMTPNNKGVEWAKMERVMENGRIPILCGPVAGSPWRRLSSTSVGRDDWKQRIGMSVLEANRGLWTKYNEYYSLLIEVAKNHAEPDKIRKRLEMGGERVDEIGQGGRVFDTDDLNARIELVEPGQMPFEVIQVLDRIGQEMQRGGFPYILFGGVNLDISGFAISQMLQAALYKLGPYKQAMQRILRQADRWWLNEFKRLDRGSVVLSGRSHGQGVFLEKFDPAAIPKDFAIEPEVDLSLPSDMLQRINIVRSAIPGNQPIMDILTALETVVKVDDPKLVLDRIDKDMLKQNPDIVRLEAITAILAEAASLDAEGKKDAAQMFREYAEFLTAQAGQVTGKAPSERRENPPGVLPPEASGISPNAVRQARNPGAPNDAARQRLGL